MLALIGCALMLFPRAFLETNGVIVDRDPGLMSELSAPSGVLIATCALMLVGAIKPRVTRLALFVGALVYGSCGIGRVISLSLHGLPSESLITATVIEIGIAVLLGGLGVVHRLDQSIPGANAMKFQPGH
jgi:hypothetical protein